MIQFTIPGDPKPQGRPRFFRRGKHVGTYDPKDSADFKQKVALFARQAGVMVSNDPVSVTAKFFIKRPKNLMRKKDEHGPIKCAKRPDWDNLSKAIADGLNGIAYRDDGQIWEAKIQKYYHEKDGVQRTEIEIS